jgi:phosphoadenosine phosphosulfate reductase
MTAEEIVHTSLAPGGGRACITCSFQAEDMVVVDMARKIEPRIPVLFLDTGYHFPETYAYRDRMALLWRLNVVNLMPAQSVAEQEAEHGLLFRSDPGRCCRLRKVEPLHRALAEFEVWLTGLRREQAPTRATLEEIETHTLPSGHALQKISPLARWTAKDVWSYLRVHEIEHLPLYDQGYTSVGCHPCTTVPLDPSNPRSGRWAGAKIECGIHISAGGG